jgi:hypothetical protein
MLQIVKVVRNTKQEQIGSIYELYLCQIFLCVSMYMLDE